MPAEPPRRIGVIGLGYVGLPVAVAFAPAFAGTVGFDVASARVHAPWRGRRCRPRGGHPAPRTPAREPAWSTHHRELAIQSAIGRLRALVGNSGG